jgi:hypothetical protein
MKFLPNTVYNTTFVPIYYAPTFLHLMLCKEPKFGHTRGTAFDKIDGLPMQGSPQLIAFGMSRVMATNKYAWSKGGDLRSGIS